MILDASALLALINSEPGSAVVAAALPEARISAVNLAEVVTKLIDIGIPEDEAWIEAADLVPVIIDFGPELAQATAGLRMVTRRLGLSLGDRACLALAKQLQLPALTADAAWARLSIGVEIRFLR
ncbi:MAG TPA: type II toxin-antitoxin system VapC family toxin [Stellaceae bacterium]|nr:type II toxin-antitoxin system VapC family toxin [Stellaceae bacterium]